MPQLQTTVLKDRATPTAVDHTFSPRDIVSGVGTVAESTGVPVGGNRLSVGLRKLPSKKFRVTLDLAMPVVQDQILNGISKPTVVRSAFANVEFTFDETSTEVERNNLVGILQSSLAADKQLIHDTVVKLQGVY